MKVAWKQLKQRYLSVIYSVTELKNATVSMTFYIVQILFTKKNPKNKVETM